MLRAGDCEFQNPTPETRSPLLIRLRSNIHNFFPLLAFHPRDLRLHVNALYESAEINCLVQIQAALARAVHDELLIGGSIMSTVYGFVVFAAIILLSARSVIQTTPDGALIELVNDKPQGNCRALGEAVGPQGNFFTGDYTSE